MIVGDIGAEVGFEGLVRTFREAVGLRVVGGRERRFDSGEAAEFLEDFGNKLRSSVRDGGRREAKALE